MIWQGHTTIHYVSHPALISSLIMGNLRLKVKNIISIMQANNASDVLQSMQVL